MIQLPELHILSGTSSQGWQPHTSDVTLDTSVYYNDKSVHFSRGNGYVKIIPKSLRANKYIATKSKVNILTACCKSGCGKVSGGTVASGYRHIRSGMGLSVHFIRQHLYTVTENTKIVTHLCTYCSSFWQHAESTLQLTPLYTRHFETLSVVRLLQTLKFKNIPYKYHSLDRFRVKGWESYWFKSRLIPEATSGLYIRLIGFAVNGDFWRI